MHCLPRPLFLFVAACTCLMGAAFAAGPQEKLIYTFPGPPNGDSPTSTLIADKAGNLYGTTEVGGTGFCIFSGGAQPGCGTVFELSPPASGSGAWTETVLYSFQDESDGALPYGGLVMDSAGNLYGAAQAGGSGYADFPGTIYELSPPAVSGGAWTFSKLYTFQSSSSTDGSLPNGTLVFDRAGNLYGTTISGGTSEEGTVFELSPPSASGGSWTEAVLHSFSGPPDGIEPLSGLYIDSGDNLYGTTLYGGIEKYGCGSGCGVVFKLTPGSSGTWTEQLLHHFSGTDGVQPYAGLTFYRGNYYGTTSNSTNVAGGTVFELTPGHGGPWPFTTLYTFSGPNDGKFNYSGVTFDASGNLYGTTYQGGSAAEPFGTVYELSPPSGSGGAWTETILVNFSAAGTAFAPIGGLLLEKNKLYGTTTDCNAPYFVGCGGYGNVFAIANF